jgi:hypothetical protein
MDNSMAEDVGNHKIQPKRTKAMDMRFHWLRDRESQKQLRIYWRPGKTNLADYFTKHQTPNTSTSCKCQNYLPHTITRVTKGETQETTATSYIATMVC